MMTAHHRDESRQKIEPDEDQDYEKSGSGSSFHFDLLLVMKADMALRAAARAGRRGETSMSEIWQLIVMEEKHPRRAG